MTHYDAILDHIKATNPCSYIGVMKWARSQGFGGSKMVSALQRMINEQTIGIDTSDGTAVIELLKD